MRRLAPMLLGALAACFRPPSGDVLFSCDPDTAPECPSGYSCESDGCCHKNGSDVEASLGECRLGGSSTGGTTFVTATETSGTTAADTGTTTATSTTTSAETSTSTSTSGASESTSSTSGTTGPTTSGTSGTGSSSTTM